MQKANRNKYIITIIYNIYNYGISIFLQINNKNHDCYCDIHYFLYNYCIIIAVIVYAIANICI